MGDVVVQEDDSLILLSGFRQKADIAFPTTRPMMFHQYFPLRVVDGFDTHIVVPSLPWKSATGVVLSRSQKLTFQDSAIDQRPVPMGHGKKWKFVP